MCNSDDDEQASKSAVKFSRNRVKYGNCERAIFRSLADIVILHIYPVCLLLLFRMDSDMLWQEDLWING